MTVERCPERIHSLGTPILTKKRTIFDIFPPQKVKVTEYDPDVYSCSHCGSKVKSVHTECLHKGDMGIYLLNYISMLKYNLRGPIKWVQEFLKINNDLDLGVKEINDVLIKMGDACKSEYYTIQNHIRSSKWVNIDEIGFHVNGNKFWLWAFKSAEMDVLTTVVDSRGRDVMKEAVGDNFHGSFIVDGWMAYSYFT